MEQGSGEISTQYLEATDPLTPQMIDVTERVKKDMLVGDRARSSAGDAPLS